MASTASIRVEGLVVDDAGLPVAGGTILLGDDSAVTARHLRRVVKASPDDVRAIAVAARKLILAARRDATAS
jgi:hypothetical protein